MTSNKKSNAAHKKRNISKTKRSKEDKHLLHRIPSSSKKRSFSNNHNNSVRKSSETHGGSGTSDTDTDEEGDKSGRKKQNSDHNQSPQNNPATASLATQFQAHFDKLANIGAKAAALGSKQGTTKAVTVSVGTVNRIQQGLAQRWLREDARVSASFSQSRQHQKKLSLPSNILLLSALRISQYDMIFEAKACPGAHTSRANTAPSRKLGSIGIRIDPLYLVLAKTSGERNSNTHDEALMLFVVGIKPIGGVDLLEYIKIINNNKQHCAVAHVAPKHVAARGKGKHGSNNPRMWVTVCSFSQGGNSKYLRVDLKQYNNPWKSQIKPAVIRHHHMTVPPEDFASILEQKGLAPALIIEELNTEDTLRFKQKFKEWQHRHKEGVVTPLDTSLNGIIRAVHVVHASSTQFYIAKNLHCSPHYGIKTKAELGAVRDQCERHGIPVKEYAGDQDHVQVPKGDNLPAVLVWNTLSDTGIREMVDTFNPSSYVSHAEDGLGKGSCSKRQSYLENFGFSTRHGQAWWEVCPKLSKCYRRALRKTIKDTARSRIQIRGTKLKKPGFSGKHFPRALCTPTAKMLIIMSRFMVKNLKKNGVSVFGDALRQIHCGCRLPAKLQEQGNGCEEAHNTCHLEGCTVLQTNLRDTLASSSKNGNLKIHVDVLNDGKHGYNLTAGFSVWTSTSTNYEKVDVLRTALLGYTRKSCCHFIARLRMAFGEQKQKHGK
jgi:hypothetical protein